MSTVFDLVLGAFREPGLVAELRDKQLPEDLAQVIRLAAGEDAALQSAVDSTGEVSETLVEASVFFLQQVLFAPAADSYRVLGADQDSSQERLRENYRWLMKWLHPDRNQDGWEAVYADRVNVAWQDLKTPDRRADYDARMPVAPALAPMSTSLVRRAAPVSRAPAGPLLSGSTVRRLPTLVLGTLGIVAAATIGIMYWAQTQTARELSERRRDRSEPVAIDASAELARTADPPRAIADAPSRVAEPPVSVAAALEPTSAAGLEPAPAVTADAGAESPVADVPAAAVLTIAPVVPSSAMAIDLPVVPPAPASPSAPSIPETGGSEIAEVREVAPQTAVNTAVTQVAASSAAADGVPVPATMTVVPTRPAVATGRPSPPAPAAVAVVRPATPAPATLVRAAADGRPPKPPASTAIVEATASVAVPGEGADHAGAAAAHPAPAPDPAPAQSDAEALIREFASAYASGDLVRFNRLFSSASAVSGALDPMRSRFLSTEMRYLEIQQLRWHSEAAHGYVRARFRDTYVPRGGRKAVTESGEIEWTIRVDAGDARIASVARNDVRR